MSEAGRKDSKEDEEFFRALRRTRAGHEYIGAWEALSDTAKGVRHAIALKDAKLIDRNRRMYIRASDVCTRLLQMLERQHGELL